MPTLQRILIAYVIITIVVLVSDRNRTLAGILSTAPINVPLILWVVWGRNNGDFASMVSLSRGMLLGIISTTFFIAVCWFGFSRRWSLAPTLAAGYVVWAVTVYGPTLLQRLVQRF